MLNIRPETLPGVYHGSIQRWVLKRVTSSTLLRFVSKCTQKRKTGYFKVRFKNGVIHQAATAVDVTTVCVYTHTSVAGADLGLCIWESTAPFLNLY
jgi:hypothetical protein